MNRNVSFACQSCWDCEKDVTAFWFRPNTNWLCFDKIPVGINSVNRILSVMCKTAGVKRKTSHCLRETCASYPFNHGVDSKFVRDRTGHRSNALLKYENQMRKLWQMSVPFWGLPSVMGMNVKQTMKQLLRENLIEIRRDRFILWFQLGGLLCNV